MSSVKLVLSPKEKSLGDFTVRRVLPSPQLKLVGPFIFFDHMGPAQLAPGRGVGVRPHPHVCLSTVTYLFEGAMLHRDTLGTEIEIRPGAVNLMTAGKGISHSERSPEALLETGHPLHGIQTWLALPQEFEEMDPRFDHYPAADLPETVIDNVTIRMIMGEGYDLASPVAFPHPTFYASVHTDAGGSIPLPEAVTERAFYVVEGSAEFEGTTYSEGQMAVLETGAVPPLTLGANTKVMIAGGEPMDGRRWIEWNFVASSKERIEQAKADWRASIAGGWTDTPFTMPPKENEYIPLPGDPEADAPAGS